VEGVITKSSEEAMGLKASCVKLVIYPARVKGPTLVWQRDNQFSELEMMKPEMCEGAVLPLPFQPPCVAPHAGRFNKGAAYNGRPYVD